MNQIVDPLPTDRSGPAVVRRADSSSATSPSRRAPSVRSQDSLSFFRTVYDSFASYRAAIIRLDGLVTANERARALPTLTAMPSADGSLELDDVEVRTPAGMRLIDPLDVRLEPGDSLVITGGSGSGKTTLLRSLAQLWPFTSARCGRPAERDACSCRSCPTCRLGDLRAVVSYPSEPRARSTTRIRVGARHSVALGHLADRLDEVAGLGARCSPPASSSASRSPGCC